MSPATALVFALSVTAAASAVPVLLSWASVGDDACGKEEKVLGWETVYGSIGHIIAPTARNLAVRAH